MATTFKQIKNNARSSLASNTLNNILDTTTVTVEDGDDFPQPGNPFYVTSWRKLRYPDPKDDPKMRIGICTDRLGDDLTITWGQLGTPIEAISGPITLELLLEDQHLKDIHTAINIAEDDIDAMQGDITGVHTDLTSLFSSLATKADDSAVVHRTGNELIDGIKTFSSAPVVPDNAFPLTAINSLVAALAAKEDAFPAGTTADYLRGDKTWQTLNKAVVGLSNVDNTSDANKPISTAAQTALDGKQPLDQDLTDIAALTPSANDILQRKGGAWTNRTPAQVKTDLSLTKSDVGLSNVDNTADTAKPVSTAQQTALDLKENTANKGVAGGYASLDGTGKVPSSQLPSFVDAIQAYANLAAFPGTGSSGVIYVANDTGKTYHWSGSAYVEISPGDVNSVFGRTGVITAQNGDYTASQITNVPSGSIAATTVQAAINELATEKQAALGYTAADDAATVHKTGTETIAGDKTFTGNTKLSGAAPALYFDETDQTSPAGQYRVDVSGDLMRFIRSSTILFTLSATMATFNIPITGSTGAFTNLTVSAPGTTSDSVATYAQILLKQDKSRTIVGGGEYPTDGIADHVQLQAAINAVHTAGGGIVEYVKPLNIDTMITLYKDVILVGQGDLTPIKPSATFASGVVMREQSGAADGLTLVNVTIDCVNKAQVGGIHIYQGNYVTLLSPHLYNMSTSDPTSKWGIRVGNYVNGLGTDTASHNMLITDSVIKNCNTGTFEQMLIVNQQDYKIVRPYFEGNTNSLAYELMLYINNRNGVIDSPHFENPSANSFGVMESDGIIVRNITGNHTQNYKLATIINTRNLLIDGIQAKNTQSNPTATVVDFFDRLIGPDGFTQIIDDTENVTIQNATVEGWKSMGSCQIAGLSNGAQYTMNQKNIKWRNITLTNSNIPFNLGLDNAANFLKDWDFDDINIVSWSGSTAGAWQLRGYIAVPTQMYNFRFNNIKVPASTGGGSFAAIRNIGMVVQHIRNSDLSATYTGYGALSSVSGGTFLRTWNNYGLHDFDKSRTAALTVDDDDADVIVTGTADQNVLNPAIATLTALGGGDIYVRRNLSVTGAILMNSPNVRLVLAPGVKITAASGSSYGIIESTGQVGGLTDVIIEGGTLDCNNLSSVQAIILRGGTYAASNGPYIDNYKVKGTKLKNMSSTNGSIGLVTIYHGRSSTLGDRGPVTNVYFWDCDFGKSTKYHVYTVGSNLETLHFDYCKFHDGDTTYSFGWNTPSRRSDTLSQARSNKDLRFNYCKWYNMNTTAVTGFTIQDTARTGWRDVEFNFCEVTGHRLSFTLDPIPANQEMFWNGHSVQHLVFNQCVFRDVKSCFSLGQSNNGPYYQTDPEHGLWITNCRFYRCYNFADFDSAIFAHITGNYFYEMYLQSVTLGYSNHDGSIFANNKLYNCILVDKPSPTVSSIDTSAISVQPHGWHVFGNTVRDDRLLANPTTGPVLSAVTAAGAPGGTFYVGYTWWNDTGETLVSAATSITLSAGQTLKALHPESSSYGAPVGAKRVNFYAGTSPTNMTLQDYMPLAIHLDYETDHYTTYKEPYWQMPTAGLISGAALPTSNTTHTRMNFGVHEVGASSGPMLPNRYESNHFYGIPNEFNCIYPNVKVNNFTNRTLTQYGEQLVEAMAYVMATASGAVTFDLLKSSVFAVTITGNITAPTLQQGHYVGQKMERRFTMGGTGSYTYTKAANEKLVGGSFTPTAAVGSYDVLIQEWDGSFWVEKERRLALA